MFMIVDVILPSDWMCAIQWIRKSGIATEKKRTVIFCLGRHYRGEVESVKQKELSNINRRTVDNNQQSYDRVYAVYLFTNCA